MRIISWWTLILLLLFLSGCQGVKEGDYTEVVKGGKGKAEKEWVVKWKNNEVDPAFLQTVQILHRTREEGGGVRMLIRLEASVEEEKWLEYWSANEDVEFIHPNQKYKVEARDEATGDHLDKRYYLDRIAASKAWEKVRLPKRKESIIVAVVDTGVDLDHPALQPYLMQGVNLKDPSLPPEDRMGHGTHVAGVIAEVWSGWKKTDDWEESSLRIMPVKVMEDGSDGDVYFTAEGIRAAVREKADVIVLAQGSWTYSETMEDAIQFAEEKGVTVVGAAGNARISNEGHIVYNSPLYYPAAFPTVLGVGSVGPDGKVVPTSNIGSGIDVVAPGEGIWAAVPEGKYAKDSGTSFAAPQVGALAALILQRQPELSPAEVRNLIRQTAQLKTGDRWNQFYGFGMINVHAAITEEPLPDIFEPNNTRETAMPFSLDQMYEGVLDGRADQDCYQLNTSYPGTLTFSLTGKKEGMKDVTLEVFIEGKKEVQYRGREAEHVRLTLSRSQVVACLSHDTDSSWKYTLKNQFRQEADEQEENDHQWNAYSVKVNPGYNSLKGTFHKKRDNDWYRLDIPEAGRLNLELNVWSPRGDPVLYIQREGSWKGKKVDEEAEGKSEKYGLKVESGSIYVRVTDYGTNSVQDPYILVVQYQPNDGDSYEPNDTSETAEMMKYGQSKKGRFGGGYDLDWYQMDIEQKTKTNLRFQIPKGGEGSTLLLYDKNMNVMEKLELSKGNRSATISQDLNVGTYFIRIQGSSADLGKEYQVGFFR